MTAPCSALIVDYGGVLTTPLASTVGDWLAADGIDPASFRSTMREFLGTAVAGSDNPVHALERGALQVPDFERQLAQRLVSTDGRRVAAEGLLSRMFAGFTAAEGLNDVVRRVRRAGRRTALLSNSWGAEYPREGWDELFDVVVISGEVGLRKPEPAIYELCAQQLNLPPAQCVFVDDLSPNVRGAVAVGMVGVLHRTQHETVRELEPLLDLELSVR